MKSKVIIKDGPKPKLRLFINDESFDTNFSKVNVGYFGWVGSWALVLHNNIFKETVLTPNELRALADKLDEYNHEM